MGIYKHPKTGIYHANYFDDSGKRCRPSLRTRDKRIAQIKFAEIIQNKEALSGNSSKLPWKAFKDKFIETITPERTKTTINHFKRACFYLEDIINPKYLNEVTPLKLQQLKSKLKEQGKGEAGINRWLRALKTMLRKAEDWNYIPPQKWQTVGSFKEVEHRVVFYTVAELKKMLKCAKLFEKTLILLGCQAGLRRGEIANLQWQDIDFKKAVLSITPKDNWHPKDFEVRHIPLAKQLGKHLKALKEKAQSLYVLAKQDGRPYTPDELTTLFARFLQREDVSINGNIHKLRHTFASLIMQNGGNLYDLSKLMGHSSIKMTEKYSHLGKIKTETTIDRLPNL